MNIANWKIRTATITAYESGVSLSATWKGEVAAQYRPARRELKNSVFREMTGRVVEAERAAHPEKALSALLDKAGMRFNQTPLERIFQEVCAGFGEDRGA